MEQTTGLEPATSTMATSCSPKLSYVCKYAVLEGFPREGRRETAGLEPATSGFPVAVQAFPALYRLSYALAVFIGSAQWRCLAVREGSG